MRAPMPDPLLVCCFSLFLGVFAAEGSSQTVRVRRNVNLRRDSTATQPPIRLLVPPEELELLSPDTTETRYLFVFRPETEDSGWVYAPYVEVVREAPNDSLSLLAAVASAIDPGWAKPTPDVRTFTGPGSGASCGPAGDSRGDLSTNRLKNRVDVPASYRPVTFRAIADLEYPATRSPRRDRWPAESVAVIRQFEGVAVTVVGYLVAIKPQGAEAVNCDMTASREVDWHMAIVEREGQGEEESIVVETTPRIRVRHPRWTPARLDPWLDSPNPVRVSGWLMFDPSHRAHLKGSNAERHFRATLWEVHPITKLEVWQDDRWIDLDDLP